MSSRIVLRNALVTTRQCKSMRTNIHEYPRSDMSCKELSAVFKNTQDSDCQIPVVLRGSPWFFIIASISSMGISHTLSSDFVCGSGSRNQSSIVRCMAARQRQCPRLTFSKSGEQGLRL
jgi:hypothetical protein